MEKEGRQEFFLEDEYEEEENIEEIINKNSSSCGTDDDDVNGDGEGEGDKGSDPTSLCSHQWPQSYRYIFIMLII